MANIDKRDKLKELPFAYNVTKAGKAMITHEGRQIMILSEKETDKLMKRVQGKSEHDVQLALAKVTGNFKHGNERMGKRR